MNRTIHSFNFIIEVATIKLHEDFLAHESILK